MLGAEVIHVESTARPDGTRLLAGLRFSEPDWWEQSGDLLRAEHQQEERDARPRPTERGRELLRRLIATCDVVVENYTPRVLEQLGLDVDAVRAIRPDIVDGAHARLRARRPVARRPGVRLRHRGRRRADLADRATPTRTPSSPYCVGDSNAGHARAVRPAPRAGAPPAHRRGRRSSKRRWSTPRSTSPPSRSSSTRRTARSSSGTATAVRPRRRRTSTCTADADDARPARDSWVAIAVATDEQWLALRDALGRPDWAMDPALDDRRRTARAARRASTRTWRRGATAGPATRSSDCLWEAGVPVGEGDAAARAADAAAARSSAGSSRTSTDPVTGTARHSTLPMRFSRGPERFHRRRAPLLGEHNDEVLRGLGVTDDELAELASRRRDRPRPRHRQVAPG